MSASVPVSFGFLKTQSNRKLNDKKFEEETTDYVLSVEEKSIKSTQQKEEKKELVIPLVLNNRWQVLENRAKQNNTEETLDERAAREIIQESLNFNNQIESGVKREDIVIPVFIQNKLPDGFETKDKLDVSLRPDESTLEDYEAIPVEEYGLAMMRGMGWKMNDPIGNTNKAVVKITETVVRPKGLGLGADPGAAQKLAREQLDSEDKGVVKGNYVRIMQGSNSGLYGKIEGQDDDGARLLIKLAIGGKIVTVSQFAVAKVSSSEYKEKSKILNREKYDKYKDQQDKQHRSEARHKEERERSKGSSKKEEKRRGKEKKRQRTSSDSDETSTKDKHSSSKAPWVRPLLRVRFIDTDYKQGRYFNKKLNIIDVVSIESCICKTEDGKLLEDIPQSSLETVIPRSQPAFVMVVSGRHKGELGEVLSRDKGRCLATVQLVKDRHIIQADYDTICEYIGDITEDENY